MRKPFDILLATAVGAGLMYLLDPDRGPRRRALLRTRTTRVRARFSREDIDDIVVEARVRSELGRVTASPSRIEVHVTDGQVTLAGPLPYAELQSVIAGVARIRGVREVLNCMDLERAGA